MDNLRAQAIQREPSTDPPDPMEGLLDINVLPARYRPQRPSFSTILAWLLFIILVGLLYLSFQRFQEGTRALSAQQLRFQTAQEELQEAEIQPAVIEDLQTEIESLRTRANEIERTLAEVNIQLLQWGPTMQHIARRAPAEVQITNINQNQAEVRISGLAETYQAALDYRDALAANDNLSDVLLLSIRRVSRETLEEEAPTAEATEATEAEESQPSEVPSEFLYEFDLQILVPAAIRPTPTVEVSQ